MFSDSAEIRETLGKDLNTVLRRFMDSHVQTETALQFYSGIVVNNEDPNQQGRCKIRVYGVFEDTIPDDDLPWATPDFSYIGSTLGSFVVPPVNTLVKVYFDGGEIYSPRYATKVFNTTDIGNITAPISEDYPNTMVMFETDAGDYFTINRSTNETIYRHASGLILTIQDNGDMVVDSTQADSGSVTWNVKGDFNVNATGAINLISTADTTIKGVNTTVQGSAKIALKHPQFAVWYPNILPVDPATTAVHGGPPTLTTLTSEAPS